jgi:hypothetical protein
MMTYFDLGQHICRTLNINARTYKMQLQDLGAREGLCRQTIILYASVRKPFPDVE